MGNIGVQTAVVLHLRFCSRVQRVEKRNGRKSIRTQSSAYARYAGVSTVGQVLIAQAGRYWRAQVQAARLGDAVPPLREPGVRAGTRNDAACGRGISRKGEILCRNASRGRCHRVELRSLIPTLRRGNGGKRAGLPVEEGKYLILPDRPAQTASVVVETVGI